MIDEETIGAYNENVQTYADMVKSEKPGKDQRSFIKNLPESAHVMDLGCGPGNSAVHFRNAGFTVDAIDASPEMIKLANSAHDLNARVATFDDINEKNVFDGIWANFSLLHAPREKFPHYLENIHNALKNSGIFHVGMKIGTDSRRDRLGRFYTYYGKDELVGLIKDTGFEIFRTSEGEEAGLAGDIDPWITIQSKAI